MRGPTSSRGRRLAAITSAALLLSLAAACGADAMADVVVSAATARDLQVAPAGTGPIVAAVDKAVVVERRATVTSVDVIEGAQVHAGQELLKVYTIGDSGAVATATNQLRADEKELSSVRARDGVIASTTIALLAKVARDRQALTDLKSSPLSVTAPADGRVSGLAAVAGTELTRTDVVMHIIDDRKLRVTAPVAASYRSLISAGKPASLTLPGGSGAMFAATVVGVGASTTGKSGVVESVPVTVELANPADALPLASEIYVRFPIDHRAPVAVDALAVLGSDQQPFVFVFRDGRVEQRAVVTGVSDGASTEIVSGVKAGDEVVISGGQKLIDGSPARPSKSAAS